MSSDTPAPDISTLIGLFYPHASEFGIPAKVTADELPTVYQKLLAHEHHMTVTVESHYDELVDVQEPESMHVANYYMRREAFVAAANRARFVVENYDTTPSVPDALVIMAKAYKVMQMDDLSSDAVRVLKLNHPEHPGIGEVEALLITD